MNRRRRPIGPGTLYQHPRKLWGLPLITIASGRDPRTGRRRVARGVVAVGQQAIGLFALGQLAVGIVAVGQLAIGALGFVGQGGFGVVGGGQLAVTTFFGVGQLVIGQLAIGQLAIGSAATAQRSLLLSPVAIYLVSALLLALCGVLVIVTQRRRLLRWAPLLRDPGVAARHGEEHLLVAGRVRSVETGEPIRTPFGDHPCVWYRVRLVAPGNGDTLGEETKCADFLVDGEAGDRSTRGARIVARQARYWAEAEWVSQVASREWLDRMPHKRLPDGTIPLLAQEWLPVDARVLACGAATDEADPEADGHLYREAGTRAVLASTARTPLLVTNLPKKELAADLKLGPVLGWLQLAVAAFCLLRGLVSSLV